jgi:hypothetical protein
VEIKGDIYKHWLSKKNVVTANNLPDIIKCCEENEKTTAFVYFQALRTGTELCEDAKKAITEHLKMITKTFRFFKKCRQMPSAPDIIKEQDRSLVFTRNFSYASSLS